MLASTHILNMLIAPKQGIIKLLKLIHRLDVWCSGH
jgi:hypothetical protein